VFTLVGDDRGLEDGLVAGVAAAREAIDLRRHDGVHPRVGSADVVPVVPLRPDDSGRAEAVARAVARRLGDDLGATVFLYGSLADGRRPAFYRRGGPGELQRRIDAGELTPAHGPALLRVIAAVGDVDAAIGVASYRTGTPQWTRPRFLPAGSLSVLTDLRHPLMAAAVPNSIALGPPHGILVTGSNMSGKTTFVRTLGVAAVLAQTINTCLAAAYDAPVFHDVEVHAIGGHGRPVAEAEARALEAADAKIERVAVDHEALAFGEPAALLLGIGQRTEHALGAGRVGVLDAEALVNHGWGHFFAFRLVSCASSSASTSARRLSRRSQRAR